MAKRTPSQRPTAPTHRSTMDSPRARRLAGAALAALLVLVAYYPSLRGDFILDDDDYLTESSLVRAGDGLYRFWFTADALDYYPVSNTTLWVEWRLWGMNPTGYRVTNLLLHIFTCLLLWLILQRLAIPAAFLASLLYAVHPVNVESVAWIAQRKDMLAVLFAMICTLSYLRSEHEWQKRGARHAGHDRWYWLSLGCFVLAMLSKGSVAMLPPLLLIILAFKRPLSMRDGARIAPFFAVSLLLVPVNVWFQGRAMGTQIRSLGFVERSLGAAAAIWFYLFKALVPLNLALIYPQWDIAADEVVWWLPLLAIIATTLGLGIYRHGPTRAAWFAWLFFAVSLVPVLGFTDVGFLKHSAVADHYQHVALIAVTTLAAAAWGVWQQRTKKSKPWVAEAAAVIVVGALAVLTWNQARAYRTAQALYEDTLAKNPTSWLAHNNLGAILYRLGRRDEAMWHQEEAIRLNPTYAPPYNNLGGEFFKAGRLADAIVQYREAVRLDPRFREAYYNLGLALARSGKPHEAIEPYTQALRLNPNAGEVHYALGIVLAALDRADEALTHYQAAVRLKPNDAEIRYNLGTLLLQQQRTQEGLSNLQEAVRINPRYAEAHNNLATALVQSRELDQAIVHYQEALRLKPDFEEAKGNLHNAMAMKKKVDPAAQE